jgi:hypothetical protein
VPHTIIVPEGTVVGRAVDAMIGGKWVRVTLLGGDLVRVEPDDICRIMSTLN